MSNEISSPSPRGKQVQSRSSLPINKQQLSWGPGSSAILSRFFPLFIRIGWVFLSSRVEQPIKLVLVDYLPIFGSGFFFKHCFIIYKQ